MKRYRGDEARMHIKPTTIKNLMKTATNRKITSTASVVLAQYEEDRIKKITEKAEQMLLERNKYREIQGLREKEMLDEEIIEEVLKSDGFK